MAIHGICFCVPSTYLEHSTKYGTSMSKLATSCRRGLEEWGPRIRLESDKLFFGIVQMGWVDEDEE